MCRLKLLTLVELMEVRSVFVDRLRSLLVLDRDPESHITATNRIASRVKLLNTLRQTTTCGVACEHRCLIELLSTALNPVHLNSYLNASFLKIGMGPDPHWLGCSNLASKTC